MSLSPISRRSALKTIVGGLVFADPLAALAQSLGQLLRQDSPLIEKAIPSSGEKIPVIGIGTARRYDVQTDAERAPLIDVIRRLPELGGRLIDTAPSYGMAERVVGDAVQQLGNRSKLFLATKVAARGGDVAQATQQMEQSMRNLHTDRIDLMEVHNLSSVDRLLPLIREWKQAGKFRYIGVTTGFDGQHDQLAQLMASQPMDFVQVNYAIDSRGAEQRVLPLAKDKGIAVLTDLPFGRTSVFQKVQGKPLPDFAKEIDCTSWAQLFLKWIVSHPSVTCAIPGTAKVEYLIDNLGAARGRLPDAAMRKRIQDYFDAA